MAIAGGQSEGISVSRSVHEYSGRLDCRSTHGRPRAHDLKYRTNRWPVRWARTDVMKPHHAAGIDEDIASQLQEVAIGANEPVASKEQLRVNPPSGRAVDIPKCSVGHPIGRIQFARAVHEQRPTEVRIADVALGGRTQLEGDHGDAYPKRLEFVLSLTQLRQVRAAGQSAEVPVKNQQEPPPGVPIQRMGLAAGIG